MSLVTYIKFKVDFLSKIGNQLSKIAVSKSTHTIECSITKVQIDGQFQVYIITKHSIDTKQKKLKEI